MNKIFSIFLSSIVFFLPSGLFAEKSDVNYPDYFPKAISIDSNFPSVPKKIPEPDYQHYIVDETGYKIWRLGGSGLEMGADVKHPYGNGTITNQHGQHFYSRTTPTNIDETYILGSAGKGKSFAALWKLSSKKMVAWVPSAKNETDEQQRQLLWDKQENNVYWYTEANKLYRVKINFNTYKVTKTLWDTLSNYKSITFGSGEGDFSDDGNRLVFIAERQNKKKSKFIISYLVHDKKQFASKVIVENTTENIKLDWAGVDPKGNYVVFNRPLTGSKMWVLPFDLSGEPRLLYKHQKHSDFVVDKQGESWIVFGHWQGLFATKLSRPLLKQVWPIEVDAGNPNKYEGAVINTSNKATASGHISRVAFLPGVIMMSRNIDAGFYFVDIDVPEKTYYVGNSRHARNSDGETSEYMKEPRGSASSSGKYIFFVSDYGKEKENAYLNMIEVK